MREILTEFDELQEAMKKINLNEEVMPIYAGKVLINENAESYKKMQQILDCEEMRSAHKYLLNLNPEQMSDEEMDQVDKIYQLGVNRGFLDVGQSPEETTLGIGIDSAKPAAPAQDTCCQAQKPATRKVKIPCWTIMYSAFKNGEIKTGECYSNSIDARSAKADCLAKLARCGYDNVSILALEQGDPDNCGFEDCCCDEDEDIKENDILRNRNHNNHISEEDLEEDDMLKSRPSNGAKHNGHIEEADDDEEDDREHNAITGRLMNGRQRNSVDELAELPGEDLDKDGEDEDGEIDEAESGDYVLTFEISDIDPETFLKGHVDQWIDSTLAKNPKVSIDKLGQTDVGVQVKVTGPYEQLEQIYSDYLKYDNLYDFEKSPADFDEFKASIEKVVESDEQIEESGNPYAAGMKTTDINGASSIGGSKPKKKASVKKAAIDEDDEDSEEDDSGDDDSSDDSSSEDSSSDDDSSDDSASDDEDSDDSSEDSEEEDSGSEDDDSEDDSEEDSSDDSEDSEDDSDDAEDDSDEGSDDSSDDSEDDNDSEDDDSEEEEEDSEEEDSEEDSEEEEDSDDSEEEDGEDKEELSDEEKADLKNEYKKTFKEVLFKCKFDDLCFDDLTIEQKVKFFTELGKKWKKNEPRDFMSDKEIEQLNKVVAKK